MYATKSELLAKVIKTIPYPDQMTDFDLTLPDHIHFTWGSVRLCIDLRGMVKQVDDSFLEGSNIAILLEYLLKVDKK